MLVRVKTNHGYEGSFRWPPEDKMQSWAPKVDQGFLRFAQEIQAIERTPDIPFLVIPHNLDFVIPDEPVWPTLERQRISNRVKVCEWIVLDPKFTKPAHILNATYHDEIRRLSGLGPQISSMDTDFSDINRLWHLVVGSCGSIRCSRRPRGSLCCH